MYVTRNLFGAALSGNAFTGCSMTEASPAHPGHARTVDNTHGQDDSESQVQQSCLPACYSGHRTSSHYGTPITPACKTQLRPMGQLNAGPYPQNV